MALEPFDEIFDDDLDEFTCRGAELPPGLFTSVGLPEGEYHLRELYCTDPECDCQFVQVHFIHESCFGMTAKRERELVRKYGWPLAGGRRMAPIAASVNYCWRWRKQRAYVGLGQGHGHWLKLRRVTPDFLGPQVPRQELFRIWLESLLRQHPVLKDLFRAHYHAVKNKGRSARRARLVHVPKSPRSRLDPGRT